MPSKKKKYNARFPAGRIKKIMQSDEEIGKVAQAVPVICSAVAYSPRTLELFVESLLTKTLDITNSRNAKTLSPSHMKQCIMSEQRFDFLRELVKNVPDINVAEEASNYNEIDEAQSSPETPDPDSDTPYDLSMPSTSKRALSRRNSKATTTSAVAANGAAIATTSTAAAAAANTYARSQSLNGKNWTVTSATPTSISISNNNNTTVKRDYDASRGMGKRSVIMHTTTALANAGYGLLPPKLSRSESTPANSQGVYYRPPTRTKNQPTSTVTSATAYAAAASSNFSNATITMPPTIIAGGSGVVSQTKRPPRLDIETAIPAPIVNYELNKPIVKIDYSNIEQISMSASKIPLSAPANFDATNTNSSSSNSSSSGGCITPAAFDFSAAPIINIDLSNIVPSKASTHCTTPAIATISIGPAMPQSATASSPLAGSASKIAAPSLTPAQFSHSTTMAFVRGGSTFIPSKSAVTTANGSFFELDEDYDNI